MWTTSWTGKSTQCCGRLPPASYVIFCFCCYHPLPYVMIPQPCGPPGLREYAQSHWVSESYRCVLKAVSEPLSTGNLCWAWLFSLAVAFLVVTLTPHLPSDRVMPGSSGKAHNPWEPAARLLSCSQTVRVGESRDIELPRDGQFFSVFFDVWSWGQGEPRTPSATSAFRAEDASPVPASLASETVLKKCPICNRDSTWIVSW